MTTEMVGDTQPGGPPPLDPALLQVIRPSANRMAAAEGSFVQLLHEDSASLVRQLPDGGWGFCERTVRTVLWIVLADQPPEAAVEGLYWLGSVNAAEGFPASEYVSIGHALVRVVRDMSADWSTTMGSAWIRLFMWMQPYLQDAAHQVEAQQEAERRQAAAEQEAARRHAFDQFARRGSTDVDVSVVGDLLDDEDEDPSPGPGYGQIMMGMTSNRRRRR